MQPTPEDFEPRRDGWFEHVGEWQEVTVGTVLADPHGGRTKTWEVIATAAGDQIQSACTLWFRVRSLQDGEERTVPPRHKTLPVVILTRSPADTTTPPITPASDAEAMALLVTELGATHLATLDNVTGEITCPDYDSGHLHEGAERGDMKPELEHLRFAHGVDTTRFEEMEWRERIPAVVAYHGALHSGKEKAAGFAHRHVPEDLSSYRKGKDGWLPR